MPSVGADMDEGKILAWPVALGERVRTGEVVLLIEADKSEVAVEAPASGFVRHHYAHPGDTVRCGTLVAALTETADEPFDAVSFEWDDSAGF